VPETRDFDAAAEPGIRAIIAADRRFDVGLFMAGAKSAYGMVLDAFWRGNRQELKALCDADVYAGFADALDARDAAGETLDARLIRIEEAHIVSAELVGTTARVTVRFVADIATVTRNAQGRSSPVRSTTRSKAATSGLLARSHLARSRLAARRDR
jgi:predicted lipid-binding transport protein (Tim44 family)